MGIDRGDLIIDTFDGSDPWEGVTQDQVDAMHLSLGLRPPGWPALHKDADAEPGHTEIG